MNTLVEILKKELYRRQSNNPRYSQRSFARQLGLSPSFLSLALRKQRRVSPKKTAEIINRLTLSDETAKGALISSLVDLSVGENPSLRRFHSEKSPEQLPVLEISRADFHKIQTWYHFAIREMTYLKDFRSDFEWIAQRLGIAANQAREAVRDLVGIGLLAWENGRLINQNGSFRLRGKVGVPSAAIRRFHLGTIERAKNAVRSHSQSVRVLGGVTMAIDPSRLEEANQRMTKFRQELMEFLEGGERKAIYQFSMQLFRLDKEEKA